MSKKLRNLMLLLMMAFTAGAYAEEPWYDILISYPGSMDGITLSGTSDAREVKIHANTEEVSCLALNNGYSSEGVMNGNHIMLEVEGGFKAGDRITVTGVINNKDAAKRATAVLFSADANLKPTKIHQFSDFINAYTATEDPEPETYTLEEDYEVLYLGRDGSTRACLTNITVTRDRDADKTYLTFLYDPATYSYRMGDEFVQPELSVFEHDFLWDRSEFLYESSNTEVATVDEDGFITIVGKGTATITASLENDEYSTAEPATFTVTVIGQYDPTLLIDYPNKKDGTAESGSTTEGAGMVKIHANTEAVQAYKLANSYSSEGVMNSNHIELKIDGGFKAGDVLTVAGVINNKDATKRATAVLFSADADSKPTAIHQFSDFINAYTATEDPVPESITLDADYDVLYLGRNGGTAAYVTLITMERYPALFSETFDKIEGTGGNDNKFSGSIAGSAMATTDATDEEWVKLEKAYKANKCAKLGTGSANATMTTRVITLEGDGGLTFRAAGWASGTNTLNVKALKADGSVLKEKDITLTNGAWKDYTIALDAADGSVTLQFTGKRLFLDDIAVNVGKVVEKADLVMAFEPTALEVELGAEFTEPVLTTPEDYDGTVTYSIDNTEVATIDATTGKLTIVAAGTATVTATAAETDTYNAGEASYALTVVSQEVYDIAGIRALESGSTGLLKLENAQVLYKGTNDMYVKDASGAIDFFKTSTFNGNYQAGDILNGKLKVTYQLYKGLPEITAVEVVEAVTKTAGEATPTELSLASVTLDKYVCDLVAVKGTLKIVDGNYFVTDGTTDVQIYDKFKIEGLGLTSATGGEDVTATGIVVPYNNNPEIALTELVITPSVTVTIGATGFATLYYGELDLYVPAGVEASIYDLNYDDLDHSCYLSPSAVYGEGNTIPAGQAVILSADPGEYVFKVNQSYLPVSGAIGCLTGSDEDAMTVGPEGSGFYKLANGPQGVGFYPGAANCGPFTSAAHKAYLVVPSEYMVNCILFETDTDGINEVKAGISKDDVIYNLHGVRVDADHLTKGIYIVNGKKMVVK